MPAKKVIARKPVKPAARFQARGTTSGPSHPKPGDDPILKKGYEVISAPQK